MLITTKELLGQNKILPAFNFSTLEICRAIVNGCEEERQPAILQVSHSELKFLELSLASEIASYFASKAKVAFSLHLDHLKDFAIIGEILASKTAVSSVMLDVEGQGYEEGIADLKKAQDILPPTFLLEGNLSEYDNAEDFIKKSGIDLLAPEKNNFVETSTLVSLAERVSLPLVLHGGSGKNAKELAEIVKAGVKIFHFNTSLREAWTNSLRQTLVAKPNEVKPYNLLAPSEEAVKKVVKDKISLLRTALRS